MQKVSLLVLLTLLSTILLGATVWAANPTVTVNQATTQADPTSDTFIFFTVVFDQPVRGFETGDVYLHGTADATTAVVQDGGNTYRDTYTIQVSGMKGDGTIIVEIPAGVASNTSGQLNFASTSTDNVVTWQATRPTVTISRVGAETQSGETVTFSADFSQPVWGFSAEDVSLDGTTAPGARVLRVLGHGSTYSIVIGGMTNDGTIQCSIRNGAAVNGHQWVGNLEATSNTVNYMLANPSPQIAISPEQENPTSVLPVNFRVVFNVTVTGFDASDIELFGSAIAGATVTVSEIAPGNGTTYNVAVNGLSSGGTVAARVVADAVQNAAGRTNLASAFSQNVLYYIDGDHPTARIFQNGTSPTNESPVSFTVVFSEEVTDFDADDVIVGGDSGATTSTVTDTGDSTAFTVEVSDMVTDGTVTIAIRDAAALDADNNPSLATETFTAVYDTTGPTCTIQQADPLISTDDRTDLSEITYVVSFNEEVTGFDANDTDEDGHDVQFTAGDPPAGGIVWQDGTVHYRITNFGDDRNFMVTIQMDRTTDTNGRVVADVLANVCRDEAGNLNSASTTGTLPENDNSVYYDAHPRFIVSALRSPTNESPVRFRVTFTESVGGFTRDDVTIGGTALPQSFYIQQVDPLDDTIWEIVVSGMPRSGTVWVVVNPSAAYDYDAPAPDLSHVNGEDNTATALFDNVRPKVTIKQAITQSDPTVHRPINFTAVFTEPVFGFTVEDVVVSGTAGATFATAVTNPTGDLMTYNISVDSMVRYGTVVAGIPENRAADMAGNGNEASTTGPGPNDDNVVTFSGVPQVTINQASDQPDPTTVGVIRFTVEFSVPVTGFDAADVVLSGTASPSSAEVINLGDNRRYTVRVTGMKEGGTVIAGIREGAAIDNEGNKSAASTSTDNEVTYVDSRPTVTINQKSDQPDPTDESPILFTVVFSEPVTGFTSGDLLLSGTANPTSAIVTDTGDHERYIVAVSGMTAAGTVIATIPANVALNSVGKGNETSTSTDNVVVYDKPLTVTVDQSPDQHDPVNREPIVFMAVFSDPVSDFDETDVELDGSVVDGATVTVSDLGDQKTYKIRVWDLPTDRSGTVIVNIPEGVATSDITGELNRASTSTDNTVTYDAIVPTVVINQKQTQNDPTGESPIMFEVIFSEPMFDFETGDVKLSGTAGATTAVITDTGDQMRYDVAVSGMTRYGTVIATVPANIARDAAFNYNKASTSGDNQVLYDTPPTVTVEQAASQADPTNGTVINFTVTFSQPVTGFDFEDVWLTGTATGTVPSVTGSGATYNIAITEMRGSGTVIVAVPAGSAFNSNGTPNLASTSIDNVVYYDMTRPGVTVNQAAGQDDPTRNSLINFTAVFTKPVSGFTGEDVTVRGTAGATTAEVTEIAPYDGTTYNIAVSGMSATGTVVVEIPANVAFDVVGNGNEASTSTDDTVKYESELTVTINQAEGQRDPTNSSPVKFTAVFNKPVTNFTSSSVSITGSAGGTKSVSVRNSGDNMTYTVEVSGMTSGGTVIANVPANAAHDASGFGNPNPASYTDNVVVFDNLRPSVTINQKSDQADPVNTGPILFTVEFSKPVTDFDASDVNLSGSANPTTASVSGSGASYEVAVTGMTGDGSVRASIPAGMVHDEAGNTNTASTSTDNTVRFDELPPLVQINQASGQSDPTLQSPINFTVVFDEMVSDFTSEDVTLSGAAGATTAVVTGSGMVYNVAVSGMTQGGTVIASVPAGVAHDEAGNPNEASTSTDNEVEFDAVPTVTIDQAEDQADPTGDSPIHFTARFSEPVTGFTTGDVRLSGTAGATTAIVTGSGSVYTVAVSGMTNSGTVIATIPVKVAADATGNFNLASTSTDNVVYYDAEALTVSVEQANSQPDPTNELVINFTAKFSKPVNGFESSDVNVTGTAGATTVEITDSGDRMTYDIAVSGMSNSGTVTVSIPANAAVDEVGKGNAASTSTDNTVQYYPQLTVTMNQADGQSDPTSDTPIGFTAVFSSPVDDFTGSDVTISGTAGFGNRTVVVKNSGDYRTYSIEVSGMSSPGTVVASLAQGVAHDDAGFGNEASTSSDNSVTYDKAPPSVTINQASDQPDPTNQGPIEFAVVFSRPVTGFAADDVLLTGTAGGVKTVTVTGSGSEYMVEVSGMTSDGTVQARVKALAAVDSDGVLSSASTSTDNIVGYETVAPTVTVNQADDQPDPAGGSSIRFWVVFSEPITGFTEEDITLSGTAGATEALITELRPWDGTTFEAAISGMFTDGTVIASLDAGVVTDLAGNENLASTSTDNVVTYDMDPEVSIDKAEGQPDPTNTAPILFTVKFNQPVVGFESGDVEVSGTAGDGMTAEVSGGPEVYSVAVTGMTNNGTVVVDVLEGVAHDSSGNPNPRATAIDNVVLYDIVAPNLILVSPAQDQPSPAMSEPVKFIVAFDEPVVGLGPESIILSGTAIPSIVEITGGPEVFHIALSAINGEGILQISVPEGATTDLAGNPSLGMGSAGVLFDITPPSVSINQAEGQPDPADSLPVIFTVVFSEDVFGFTANDVMLSGTAGASTVLVTGSGRVYNVAVSDAIGPGSIIASIPAGVVQDAVGNWNVASTSRDNEIMFNDGESPTVTVSKAPDQKDPTKESPVKFRVVFSRPVTAFTASDVRLSGSAGANSAEVTGSGTTYIVSVRGMTSPGTVEVRIPAGAAQDAAGNVNRGSNTASVTFDNEAPGVTIDLSAGQPDPTNKEPINFTARFSEPVFGFTSEDVELSGSANPSMAVVTDQGDHKTYTVSVSGMSGPGRVNASIPAGVAEDAAGNKNTASTSNDNSVVFDNSALKVTVEQSLEQVDPTNQTPIHFTVLFSRPVKDFSAEDIELLGTATHKKATVTGSDTTYNVAVTGMTKSGTVGVQIPADRAHDEFGNANEASTSVDNSVLFDLDPPVVKILRPTEDMECTRNVATLSLAGVAEDAGGISRVEWISEYSGSGICEGGEEWSSYEIEILGGEDTIIVTAIDNVGLTASDSITVNVREAAPDPGDWLGLAMVSLPIIPDEADPKKEVGFMQNFWAAYKPDIRSFLLYPDQGTWFVPAEATRIRGFWARFGNEMKVPAGMVPPQNRPVSIPLRTGWNMIGQPFIEPVQWNMSAIKVRRDTVERTLRDARLAGWVMDYAWGWASNPASKAGGEYYLVYDPAVIPGSVSELAPWKSYWIYSYSDCELMFPSQE